MQNIQPAGGGLVGIRDKVETFTCGGKTANVILADSMAWSYLESVLGGDPLDRWTLKVMQHAFGIEAGTPYVQFLAEFIRSNDDPEAEA